jgi:hypothetical protein
VGCACSGRSSSARPRAASWSVAATGAAANLTCLMSSPVLSPLSPLHNPNPWRQVWCVSRHDDVPDYLRKIDRALSRRPHHPSAAYTLSAPATPDVGPASELGRVPKRNDDPAAEKAVDSGIGVQAGGEEALHLAENDALLSPGGDVPMRLAVASVADLERLAEPGTRPRPRLAAAQRGIGWPGGTLLLLGRSGTGKTVCLCERMVADRERAAAQGGALKQLFVARSPRICELVREIQVAES